MITRRAFLRTAGAALWSFHYRDLAADEFKVNFVREFSKAQAAQSTPDGKKLIYLDWGSKRAGAYGIAEIETGRTLLKDFVKIFRTLGFKDDNHILVREGIPGSSNDKLSFIDFFSKERTERILPKNSPSFNNLYLPLRGNNLLAIHTDPDSYNRRSFLSLTEFPGLRELMKVPYTIQPREPMTKIGGMQLSNDFDLKIPANQSTIAYSYDYTLVCRSAEDLRILWTQKISPPLKAHKLAVSAEGGHVAAFATNSQWIPGQSESLIFVYEGKTGSLEARLSLKGTDGSAISPSGNNFGISPDGKLISVTDIQGENNEWVVRIHIHRASTGKRLATVLHDKVNNRRGSKLPAYTSSYFTSDGRYLVTSGINTKIWSIDQASL
jgi:hypothetical protein